MPSSRLAFGYLALTSVVVDIWAQILRTGREVEPSSAIQAIKLMGER